MTMRAIEPMDELDHDAECGYTLLSDAAAPAGVLRCHICERHVSVDPETYTRVTSECEDWARSMCEPGYFKTEVA